MCKLSSIALLSHETIKYINIQFLINVKCNLKILNVFNEDFKIF